MSKIKLLLFVTTCYLLSGLMPVVGQRTYTAHSVLSTGNWYKIAARQRGVYRIDIPFLNSLGVNTSNLISSSIRLYGNGGQMLAEANAGPWTDDLQENAISVVDGGDGIINGQDYILFYADGPDKWIKDSANKRFSHEKNLYSEQSFYFLGIGGTGKRIQTGSFNGTPTTTLPNFTDRYFHELDTVNFLASGREWYGEEFANIPGRVSSRDFRVSIPNLLQDGPMTVSTQCIARSIGAPSRFDIKVNNQVVGQPQINSVGAGIYDLFAQSSTAVMNTTIPTSPLIVTFTYQPGSFNSQGWLNWFELFPWRKLSMQGTDQLLFRDWTSTGPGIVAEYIIENPNSTTQVWDITDPLNPERMNTIAGQDLRVRQSGNRLHEFIAFNSTGLLQPVAMGRIANQDLHSTSPADYLIVAWPAFVQQAQRLADFHRQRSGLRVAVVTTDQVFNEFASGSPDPVAIRDFAKMYFDKYGNTGPDRVKYLLLFGDASYDYKNRLNNNTNYVPAWQNNLSLDPLSTYASDDFYGFLDDTEDINSGLITNYLDLGIGRVPAKNAEEAKNFVDKIYAYHDKAALGPWRNNFTFIADDEDVNLHLQDAEIFTTTAAGIVPVFDQQKIYLDAYQQESGSGGSRYPQANLAINNQVFNGTLIWNYNGHGGPRRLAEETVLDQEIINNWNNPAKLPLFITATCDFAPYDNPLINSIGEDLLVRPKTGGIALMTTTRVVFAFSNRIMNDNYLRHALQPDANGIYKTLGDAMKEAKNFTYQTSADISNNRKFTLLGDPAMTIAFPKVRTRATLVNGLPVTQVDTLRSTEKVTIEGEVTDVFGNPIADFNGALYPVIFDKPQSVSTLANDPSSQVTTFLTQTNTLFKGKASVVNGKFSFSFRVPKDINYQFGNGKLSLYAENGSTDANGFFTGFIVGGTGIDAGDDSEGPEIKSFLNDDRFVNGGITNENPVLILKLADSSGINTAGTGIGHDIVATLDNDHRQYFILNDFYQGELDSYQKGEVRFQLPTMKAGNHTLKIKAWDVVNNSSEINLEFTVAADEQLVINHVLNYPNPFTTNTSFWFEHNKPGLDLQVRLQIFTVSGRIIKMIQQTINTVGNRSDELEWNGRDQYGDKVGKGVYLYKLSVTAPGGQRKEKIEKLVIF